MYEVDVTALLSNAARLVAIIRPGSAMGQRRSDDGRHKDALVRARLRAEYSALFEQELNQTNPLSRDVNGG